MVELGCGFGQDTRNLAQAGYRVLGVDVSSSAVEKAKRLTDAALLGHGPGQVGAAPPRNLPCVRSYRGRPLEKDRRFSFKLLNSGPYSFKRYPVASPRQLLRRRGGGAPLKRESNWVGPKAASWPKILTESPD